MMENQETRTLPKGTMVHIGGIPLFLEEEAKLTTHKGNWDLALEVSMYDVDEEKDSSK